MEVTMLTVQIRHHLDFEETWQLIAASRLETGDQASVAELRSAIRDVLTMHGYNAAAFWVDVSNVGWCEEEERQDWAEACARRLLYPRTRKNLRASPKVLSSSGPAS